MGLQDPYSLSKLSASLALYGIVFYSGRDANQCCSVDSVGMASELNCCELNTQTQYHNGALLGSSCCLWSLRQLQSLQLNSQLQLQHRCLLWKALEKTRKAVLIIVSIIYSSSLDHDQVDLQLPAANRTQPSPKRHRNLSCQKQPVLSATPARERIRPACT